MKRQFSLICQRWPRLWSGVVASICLLGLQLSGVMQTLVGLNDLALFRLRGPQTWDERVVVIGIDGESLDAFNEMKWSRDLYADLLTAIAPAEPRVIGFSFLFTHRTERDRTLADAIAQSPPVVLGVAWDSKGELQVPPPIIERQTAAVGHITEFVQVQGIAQQETLVRHQVPSLAWALTALAGAPELDQLDPTQPLWINWSASTTHVPTYSFLDVLQGEIPEAALRDKIVIVGMTAPGFDTVKTPFDIYPPSSKVYVHAAIVSNLLQGSYLKPIGFPPQMQHWWLYLGWGLLLSRVLAERRMRMQLAIGLGVIVVWFGIGLMAFHANYLLPMIAPILLTAITMGISILYWESQIKHLLSEQTRSDPITQLPNRAAFLRSLKITTQRTKEQAHCQFGVIFVDIDRFNSINTNQGHAIGNEVLRTLAQRLRNFTKMLPYSTTLAHLGADEFTLLCRFPEVIDIMPLLKQLSDCVQVPFVLPSGQELFYQVSIGAALSWQSPLDYQTLLLHAEAAMYQARLQRSSNNYAIFNEHLHRGAIALWQLELDLRQTLQNTYSSQDWQTLTKQGFYLEYQPIVSLATGKIYGFEALVRWQHPQRGLLSPLDFIPLAEETGMITLLGQWVLYRACYQLRAWRMTFPQYADLMITVNLSPIQLLWHGVVEQVGQVLSTTGLDSKALHLEITENTLMENSESAIALLEQLRYQGIELCLDDFGMGYSSLSRLKSLPITMLKIDRSFVQQLGEEAASRQIINTILDLSHQLKMTVVAEGIESRPQLDYLRTMGCDYGQGYLFAKPLNAEMVEQLLRSNPQW